MAIHKLAGYPDETITGVPPGTTLKPSGSITVSTPGAVISGLDIKGTVTITAPNVTIQNCRITASSWAVVDIRASGAVIKDSEINGLNAEGVRGISGAGTILRCDIHNVEDGIYLTRSDALIQDNYIHDLRSDWSGPHYDGIATDGGVSNIVIRHNTISNENGQTSAVMLSNYFGSVSNVLIENNHLAGGGYTLYSDGQFNGGTISGVQVLNNHLDKGQFGFVSIRNNSPVWSGNVDDRDRPPTLGKGIPLGPEPVVSSPESPGPSHGGSIPSVPLPPPAKGLAGGGGNDKIYGTGGDDKIIGANGNDKLVGLDGADKVYGGAGHDDLYGNRGVDALYGGPGNDHLYGSTGADKLFGGHGNDVLVGGSGADSLYGGGGADRFQVNSVGESRGSARDVIYDFERREDKIDLSGIDAITSGRDNAFIFKGQGSFAENVDQAGQLKYHHETIHGISYTIVEGTVDRRPGVDFEIALRGKLTLTGSDFHL